MFTEIVKVVVLLFMTAIGCYFIIMNKKVTTNVLGRRGFMSEPSPLNDKEYGSVKLISSRVLIYLCGSVFIGFGIYSAVLRLCKILR